ncbi:hypothetical protein BKA61DRAFT_617745 [Leptodontidium sp. MPI-SDFR-AT-0119]|nr:hypothetical protein BKA61DRAFT_617745 [Leptodontidium sp. MPI-SDFR-AT-0119]
MEDSIGGGCFPELFCCVCVFVRDAEERSLFRLQRRWQSFYEVWFWFGSRLFCFVSGYGYGYT